MGEEGKQWKKLEAIRAKTINNEEEEEVDLGKENSRNEEDERWGKC